MASMVDRSVVFGPGFDPHHTFDSVADPTLLSDSLASFFDSAFFFQRPDPRPAPSASIEDDFATHFSGSAPPDTLDTGGEGSDSARRDSLFPCKFDEGQLDTASQEAKSPQTTHEPPEPSSKRRKSTRRNRGETANTAKARAKREVNLEKNRMAANRCRKKKRDWMDKLEKKHRQLSARNNHLRLELAGLNDTVYALKELVLQHAKCGSRPIDDYVRREAEQVQAKVRLQC